MQNSDDVFVFANGIVLDLKGNPAKIGLKKLKLKSKNQTFAEDEPILIQAFFVNESPGAVPVDQIIFHPNQKILF